MFGFNDKNLDTTHENQGLAVTLEELMMQQKYLPYMSYGVNRTSANSGGSKSAFKGRGMEFEEVRAYNFGDDVRDIDWRVSARKPEPYTKVFREEKDREIVVVLDLSASMVFGTRHELKSVTACKIAALIGWLTLKHKDRFGLLLFDGKDVTYFKPRNDTPNLINIFNKIADKSKEILIEQHHSDITQALHMLQLHQKGQGTVFILSDFHNFGSDKFSQIAILAKKHQVCCINIFDVLEEVAPQDGVYAAQYDSQKAVFDTEVGDFKTSYQEHFRKLREDLRQNCQKLMCGYIEVRTDVPIFKQLSTL